MPVEDIVSKILVQAEFVDKITQPFKRTINSLQNQLKKTEGEIKRVPKTITSITDAINESAKRHKDFLKPLQSISPVTAKFGFLIEQTGEELKKSTFSLTNFKNRLQQLGKVFQGWALSVLFFGMAIQRTFERIVTAGVTSFNAFTSSVEGATTNLTILGGWIDFLKFTIGDAISTALSPFMDTIIGVIEAVSEWITDNSKLAGWIIIFGVIIGGLLFLLGFFVLAMFGLAGALAFVIGFFSILSGVWIPLLATALGFLIFWIFKNWRKVWDWVAQKLKAVWDWIVTKVWQPIAGFFDKWVVQPLKAAWDWIVENIWKPVKEWFTKWIIDPIKNAWQGLIDFILNLWESIKNIWKGFIEGLKELGSKFLEFLGFKQFGGFVPFTGPYMLHAGERVVPAGTSNNFGGITINISTTGGVDGSAVAQQIMNEIRRYI